MFRVLVAAFLLAVLITPPAQADETSDTLDQALSVRMTRWRVYYAYADEWQITTAPACSFGLEFINRSGSQISAIRGTLHLYDAFDTELGSFSITGGGLPATTLPHVQAYNPWVPTQELVTNRVFYRWETTGVVWADGRRVSR